MRVATGIGTNRRTEPASETGAASRQPMSIEGVFDAHAAAVFRLAYAMLRDADDAQDVVQDTFVIAWRKRRSLTLVDGSPLPWLLATGRRVALAQLRRRRTRSADPLESEDGALRLATAAASEFAEELRDAISSLPDADRRVVELVLIEGWSYAEAAAVLGLSVAAAGKRLQRAKARLRSDLRGASTDGTRTDSTRTDSTRTDSTRPGAPRPSTEGTPS